MSGFSSVGSALAFNLAGYRFGVSSNPVVGVSVKRPSVDRQTSVCLPLPLVCSTDASPWSAMVECGWRVGLELVRKPTSSLTRGNNYIIAYQPWASWITGVVS